MGVEQAPHSVLSVIVILFRKLRIAERYCEYNQIYRKRIWGILVCVINRKE